MEIKHYYLSGRNGAWLGQNGGGEENVLRWYDVRMEENEAELSKLDLFLSDLGVDRETVNFCTVPVRFPGVEVSGSGVFLRFPLRPQWNSERACYVMILCMKGALVSIGPERALLFDRVRQRLEGGSLPAEPSSQALLFFIMDVCTDISTLQYMAARSAVEALADRLDDEPDNLRQDELIATRRRVSRLYSQFEDQHYCMGLLQGMQAQNLPFSHLKTELRDILDSQNHVVRSQDQLETRLRDLHNDCLLHAQRKTDYRLRVLTVLTSLCMPLSVIAGIYGMNFHFMPELEWKFGYFFVLGLMISISVSMLVFFFRRGWFK